MTNRRPFSREQIDAMLPFVRKILEEQRSAYLRVRRSLAAFNTIEDLDQISGDHRLPKATRDDLAEIRGCMLELDELGVAVEGPELGIVTAPGMHRGEVVKLCWKLGEDRVRFWFPADATYEARRPLDSAAR